MAHESIPPLFELTSQSAAKLIRDSFPERKPTEIVEFGRGADNIVFRAQDGYIFRFAKEGGISRSDEREVRVLPELQKSLSLPIPNIEFIGRQPNGFIFIGYKAIEGVPFTADVLASLKAEIRNDVMNQMATFLVELRAFPTETARRAAVAVRDPKQFIGRIKERCEVEFNDHFSAEEHMKIQSLFTEYLLNPKNFTYQPCLVHADLGPSHILYDEKTHRISGIIDWTDMVITDPAFELQDIYQSYGKEFTQELLERMGSSVDVKREVELASFFTVFRNLQRYMRRITAGDTRASRNLEMLKKELERT